MQGLNSGAIGVSVIKYSFVNVILNFFRLVIGILLRCMASRSGRGWTQCTWRQRPGEAGGWRAWRLRMSPPIGLWAIATWDRLRTPRTGRVLVRVGTNLVVPELARSCSETRAMEEPSRRGPSKTTLRRESKKLQGRNEQPHQA